MALGSAIGIVVAWVALRGTDADALAQAIARVDLRLVALALVSVGLTILAGALRWRVLLALGGPLPAWWTIVSAIIVGQMLNILLPVRVGEVARVYLVAREKFRPIARVIGTLAVEKLADGLMFGVAALILLLFLGLPAWAVRPAQVLLTSAFALGAAAVVLGLWARPLLGWMAATLARTGRRSLVRVSEQIELAADVVAAVADWRVTLTTGLLSAAILLLSASTNYILFRAFDLPLPPAAALFLVVMLQISTASVPTPGSLGVFHYVTMLSLSAFAIERDSALAYAIVLYVVALGPKVVLGLFIVAGMVAPPLPGVAARGGR